MWKDDAAVKEYLTTIKTFAPDIDPYDQCVVWLFGGESLVAVLRQCGGP